MVENKQNKVKSKLETSGWFTSSF